MASACSYLTFVLTLFILWTSAVVNSSSLGEVLGNRGDHALALPENLYWQNTQMHKRGAERVCGTRLVVALRALCKGEYAVSRRSDPKLRGQGEDSDYSEPSSNDVVFDPTIFRDSAGASTTDFEMMWPYNPKALAFKILTEGGAHQRFRRTLTSECCHKPCTREEMRKYCAR